MMRKALIALIYLFVSQAAIANAGQVPLLADGTVDLHQVLPTFKVTYSISSEPNRAPEYSGELLGYSFEGTAIGKVGREQFILSFQAKGLGDHASYLIANLITETLCLQERLSPGPVEWTKSTKNPLGFWEVPATCLTERRED